MSIVGALQDFMITRPKICFEVNKVCQFMQTPLEEHWKAVKRILKYLASTVTHVLRLQSSKDRSVVAYCDADWATNCNDRKSTTGYCIYFGKNLVSWSSKKQSTVARSSTEAENRSMAFTVTESLWIKSLLRKLNVKLIAPPQILCGNQGAVLIIANFILHARTKHLEIDLNFVRERAIKKEIQVFLILACHQIADGSTKPLSGSIFNPFRRCLGVGEFLKLRESIR